MVDIVDPHLTTLEDAVPKARGLAEYAEKHGLNFGRIEIVHIGAGGKILRLNLLDDGVRANVKTVASSQHLRQLYDLM